MADIRGPRNQKPAAAEPAQPAAEMTPEAAVRGRIEALQKEVDALSNDLRTVQGKLANRDPVLIAQIHRENAELKTRLGGLQKALYALLTEMMTPSQPDDLSLRYEVLRRAAIDYFKKANVDPEIWKNIAY
jgi:hypothetical protein